MVPFYSRLLRNRIRKEVEVAFSELDSDSIWTKVEVVTLDDLIIVYTFICY